MTRALVARGPPSTRRNAALASCLTATPLTFGTAGLRGPIQPGPGGMNRANVRFATLGVLGWMGETRTGPRQGRGRGTRRPSPLGGVQRRSSRILLGAGVRVIEMPGPLPTPLVAYCVKSLGAAAGIMVTASHNPPNDNGYKLYASDGAQIVPPDDEIVERLPMRLAISRAPGYSARARRAQRLARRAFQLAALLRRGLRTGGLSRPSRRQIRGTAGRGIWRSPIRRCMVSVAYP